MNLNIKIVRLQNGEDIMGNVTSLDVGKFNVSEPMSVGLEYRNKEAGLIMNHWLPVQLLKKNEITIEQKDILGVLEPSEEFCEYYLNTVEKIKALLAANLLAAKDLVNDLEEGEIDEIMEAYEELKTHGDTLH